MEDTVSMLQSANFPRMNHHMVQSDNANMPNVVTTSVHARSTEEALASLGLILKLDSLIQ